MSGELPGYDNWLDNWGNPGIQDDQPDEIEHPEEEPMDNDEVTQPESYVVTNPEHIEMLRLIALRAALGLEARGMRKKGRSARAIANAEMGTNFRTAKDAYSAFNSYLVELGATDRPLK